MQSEREPCAAQHKAVCGEVLDYAILSAAFLPRAALKAAGQVITTEGTTPDLGRPLTW